MNNENGNILLDVSNLSVNFYTEAGVVNAVDNVSFAVERGRTLGVVGESGCGKSVTARALMNIVPRPRGRLDNGSITYYPSGNSRKPVDIASLDHRSQELRHLRGNDIAMIFQEPMSALHPTLTIGTQIMEAIRLHQKADKKTARAKAIESLELVGIPAAKSRIDAYPHELSGGMRQRAMIAMALACNPALLIADEPTTALDVTIEAQIIQLIKRLQKELNMSVMFITHDLGVIGELATDVVVMYAGRIVEKGSVVDIFYNPKHPYTHALLRSIPRIGKKEKLEVVKGTVPSLIDLPEGCNFAPRCPYAMEKCRRDPVDLEVGDNHTAQCWLYEESREVNLESLSTTS